MSPESLHARLRHGAEGFSEEAVTVAVLAAMHGPAVLGTLLILLAVPCVLPIPGIGNVMGSGMMVMGLAMLRGRDSEALPPRLARFAMSAPNARRIMNLLARFYEWAGRWSHRRMPRALRLGDRCWVGAKLALMGFVIFLPLPLGNLLPALAVTLMGLGLAFRDGLAVLLAWFASAAAVGYTLAIGIGFWGWVMEPLLRWARSL